MVIYQDGVVEIPNFRPGIILGTDPDDVSSDTIANPDNPAIALAGKRDYLNIGFSRTVSSMPTKAMLPAGRSQNNTDVTFTSVDQSPEQWKYAWIAPADGYIEAISMLSDTAFGQNNAVSTINQIEVDVYIQAANTTTDLNSLSPNHTWDICYGWSSLGSTHAGKAKTWRLGDTTTNTSIPATRSVTQFAAGDKLWFAFDGGSNTDDAKYTDNTTNSGTAYINMWIHFVLDERSLAT